MFPTNDKRNPMQTLVPKLMAATEKFDMVPVRDKAQFDPQPWDGSEVSLPGKCENGGYFLRDGAGAKKEVGGLVVRAMASRKETDGRFSIYEVQASALHKGVGKSLRFAETHHAVQTVAGVLKVIIDGKPTLATFGETVFVPAGIDFEIAAESSYAKGYIFANGGGVGEVLMSVGSEHAGLLVPDEQDVKAFDASSLKGLESELKFTVV